VSFAKIGTAKDTFHLRLQNNCPIVHMYFPFWFSFSTRDLDITLIGICDFYENRGRGEHTLLNAVNETTFVRVMLNGVISTK
jgi:hypothetical protein